MGSQRASVHVTPEPTANRPADATAPALPALPPSPAARQARPSPGRPPSAPARKARGRAGEPPGTPGTRSRRPAPGSPRRTRGRASPPGQRPTPRESRREIPGALVILDEYPAGPRAQQVPEHLRDLQPLRNRGLMPEIPHIRNGTHPADATCRQIVTVGLRSKAHRDSSTAVGPESHGLRGRPVRRLPAIAHHDRRGM